MKRFVLIIITVLIITSAYFINKAVNSVCPAARNSLFKKTAEDKGLKLLAERKDSSALNIFEQILKAEPQNPDALWGKAEVLRRRHKLKESEQILNGILAKDPGHLSSLNSLAYIKYLDNKIDESERIVERILKHSRLDKENQALAFLLLGAIYSKRTQEGWLFSKIKYGTQIRHYFELARQTAPEMPETHLGIGTFYLKAPAIVGGDINKALKELELSVSMAPDFATANARLAQAYKKMGAMGKYNYYLNKAKTLDPLDEAVKEDEQSRN